jgi:hypothetical protein
MATVYSDNYNKAWVNDPSEAIPAGQHNAHKKVVYAEYTPVANVLAINDVIKLFKLPKGARVIEATVKAPSLGTTGIMSLGNAASDDAVEAADADSLIVVAQLDAGGQAVLGKTTSASAGAGKKFAADVDIQLVFTEATDAALGDTIQCWVEFVMD